MEKHREGMAMVLGADGALVAPMSELNARMVVEAVNARMELEKTAYALRLTAEEIRDMWNGEDWL